MFTRRAATVVTLVIVAAFVLVSVAPAFAAAPAVLPTHAKLKSTTPADGSTVDTVREVTLTFSEDVNPSFVEVRVAGPSGAETDGKPTTDGGTVTQPLTADLAAGEHVVTYRVVSTDGHPVTGTVTFTTTAAPASASPSATASASAPASPTAAATPAPTGTTVAAPQGTEPVSADSGSGTRWLVIGGIALLLVVGLGAAWRTMGGRAADADQDGRMGPDAGADGVTRADAGDVAQGPAGTDPEPTARTPIPPA